MNKKIEKLKKLLSEADIKQNEAKDASYAYYSVVNDAQKLAGEIEGVDESFQDKIDEHKDHELYNP